MLAPASAVAENWPAEKLTPVRCGDGSSTPFRNQPTSVRSFMSHGSCRTRVAKSSADARARDPPSVTDCPNALKGTHKRTTRASSDRRNMRLHRFWTGARSPETGNSILGGVLECPAKRKDVKEPTPSCKPLELLVQHRHRALRYHTFCPLHSTTLRFALLP